MVADIQRAAPRVRGLKAVANEIEVRLPSSSQRTDADTAQAAGRALECDAFIPPDRVKVTVSKGWVTLGGEVKSRPTATNLKKQIEDARVLWQEFNPGPAIKGG